jgi:hypothetical protein
MHRRTIFLTVWPRSSPCRWQPRVRPAGVPSRRNPGITMYHDPRIAEFSRLQREPV